MSETRFIVRFSIRLLAVVAVTLGAYLLLIRPWFLRWGATDSEIHQTWPGDELSPTPAYVATRAVTIHAPVEVVWRWVAQVGQDRAGFYSYNWLENLFRADIQNAKYIAEEWQTRKVGDTVWLARKDRYHGEARQTVAVVTSNRALVLVSAVDYESISAGGCARGSWAFILERLDSRTNRLILRSRAGRSASIWQRVYAYLLFDPAHFILERKMMLGIKHRSEECMLYGNPVCAGT